RPEEFAHFGVPRGERGRRFEEGLRLLLRAWAGEAGPYGGRCFQGEALPVVPRPVQQPRPPIWVGGWAEAALRRAAELGDAWLPGPTGDLTTVARAFERYARFVEAAGGRVEARERPLMRELFVATDHQSREEAEAALARMYRERYVQWGLGTVQAAGAEVAALGRDRFIVGGPDEVLREIERYRGAVGVTHLMCRMHFPGLRPEAVQASMRLFAGQLLPELRRG
ncbi:MAG: LLM class flavin-dependent oxidoreductase, partial [Deltaproteobacteria bacterium]|nr:LLM class flavin-dependent oxidoreductase [Deltaproteobacteria bacterium]